MTRYHYPLPQPPKLSEAKRQQLKARMEELKRQERQRTEQQSIICRNLAVP